MENLKNIEELEKGKIILVFSTPWCGDCVALSQYIDKICEKFTEWKFIYVERDENLELAKHYNVFGIPSFVALENSKVVGEFISKESKSYDAICEWINKI